ncbi:SulP family inorganic anion transporter [Rhodococcus opacus]|uniref:SulP family inorganic anion transporter n=1 Tax=Rhodococcus opacus TaxID=37919 RepID=UPI00247589BA|nr:SulP family inorganic anion transporter [Rhodococcus opacus]MDH6286862.1 SulP family sulfate permease [Rhodococcus opacus]
MPSLALRRPVWLHPTVFRIESLSALVVAMALIPEALSFSIIVGVDPRVGLFTAAIMAMTIAFTGGRPAMISAATGSVSLVLAPLMASHGLQYLIAAVFLGGAMQILLAVLGVARLMRFLPRSVMVGFCNALGILIFVHQFPYLTDVPWAVYALLAAGLALLVWIPKLTTAVPAPLLVIVGLTAFTVLAGVAVPTVGDQGELPDGLPTLIGLPDVPLTADTLQIIAPFALAMAVVGLLESLMSAKLVDSVTDTHSDKTRESWGQGVANIVTGLFGGMGGCALIGQTIINVKTGGARTRLSTFLSGAFLLILVVGLGDVVGTIPMAALVAVMVLVAATTFDWHSVRTLRRMPLSETMVMLSTVAGTLATDNLAIGVGVGVLLAMVLFARRVAHMVDVRGELDGDVKTYRVSGQLFFASSNDLVFSFDYADDPGRVVIDLSGATIWDASTVAALDGITTKYASRGTDVTVEGLNPVSEERYRRLTGRLGD